MQQVNGHAGAGVDPAHVRRRAREPCAEDPAQKAEKKRKLEEAGSLPRLHLVQNPFVEGIYCPFQMQNKLPEMAVEGKLLRIPMPLGAFSKAAPSSLDLEFRLPFLCEHEHGLAVDFVDPEVYVDAPVADGASEAAASSKKPGKRLPPSQRPEPLGTSIFLRNATYIQNDIYSLGNFFRTGHDGAEKKLHRAPLDQTGLEVQDPEKVIERIKNTFDGVEKATQEEVLSHPKKRGLQAVKISPILPDTLQAHRRFVQASFDENPVKDSANPVPVFMMKDKLDGADESTPTYFVYTGDSALHEMEGTLKAGEKVELKNDRDNRQLVYVWENRWLCEATRTDRVEKEGVEKKKKKKALADLVLALPPKDGDPTGRRPTLYLGVPPTTARFRKQLSATGGAARKPDNKRVNLYARRKEEDEIAHEDSVQERMIGTADREEDEENRFLAELKQAEKDAEDLLEDLPEPESTSPAERAAPSAAQPEEPSEDLEEVEEDPRAPDPENPL